MAKKALYKTRLSDLKVEKSKSGEIVTRMNLDILSNIVGPKMETLKIERPGESKFKLEKGQTLLCILNPRDLEGGEATAQMFIIPIIIIILHGDSPKPPPKDPKGPNESGTGTDTDTDTDSDEDDDRDTDADVGEELYSIARMADRPDLAEAEVKAAIGEAQGLTLFKW